MALDELDLDPTARAVFVLVLDNGKDRGWRCRLSNATIGRILGRCPMTISRALGRLEAAGLVRRELAAGGRIRLAILVTWEGVADPRLTGHPALRREHLTGSALALEGLGARAEQTIPPIQGEIPDAARSSLGGEEDAASRIASGPEAAAYLRACVAAGRRGEPMPPPPGGTYAIGTPPGRALAAPPTPNEGIMIHDTLPAPPVARGYNSEVAPGVPPVAFTAEVDRMVKALGERLKSEDVGRRRVGPKRLAMQLAELRRRHGKRE